MLDTGVSVYSAAAAPADAGAEDLAGAADAASGWYFSTSSRTMRPPGPVPLTLPSGTPRSSAIAFAIGLA
jgi:hypothetical protein